MFEFHDTDMFLPMVGGVALGVVAIVAAESHPAWRGPITTWGAPVCFGVAFGLRTWGWLRKRRKRRLQDNAS